MEIRNDRLKITEFIETDTGTLALMMYGRLDASAAIAHGKPGVDGDSELAARFGQCFKGI